MYLFFPQDGRGCAVLEDLIRDALKDAASKAHMTEEQSAALLLRILEAREKKGKSKNEKN